jgi:hypothetical protein
MGNIIFILPSSSSRKNASYLLVLSSFLSERIRKEEILFSSPHFFREVLTNNLPILKKIELKMISKNRNFDRNIRTRL